MRPQLVLAVDAHGNIRAVQPDSAIAVENSVSPQSLWRRLQMHQIRTNAKENKSNFDRLEENNWEGLNQLTADRYSLTRSDND